MRRLEFNDLFKVSKIIDKLDIKKFDLEDGASSQEIGTAIIMTIFSNTYKAEKEINEFLADVFEMKAREWGKLSLLEVAKKIKELKESEDLSLFFQQVGQLTGSKS